MMEIPNQDDRASRRSRLAWYGLTVMGLIAIILLNSDQGIVEEGVPLDLESQPNKRPAVGAMTPLHPKPIHWISILGERNSGTRWLYSHIGSCFNETIGVKRYLTRYKHWFQYKNATKYPHDTLVLAQFRNPYDWLEAMRNVPHHSPSHINLQWQDFLEKEWSIERMGLDLNMTKDDLCQEDFRYDQLVSCSVEPMPKSYFKHKLRYSENQPFYELQQDGSGKPFKNIMEMRAAKIRNFLDVREYVGIADVWTIQYEYLLTKGTEHLLTKIEEWTGQKRQCEAIPPQNRRKRPLSRSFARYVNKNLDWTAEGLIGYTQEEVG